MTSQCELQQEAVVVVTETELKSLLVFLLQWKPSAHSGDSNQKHRWCWPVVPPAGDADRRRDGEEDQRPGQKHKVGVACYFKSLFD